MAPKTDPVDTWLESCSSTNTRYVYTSYFRLFEEHMQKTGREMLTEFRAQVSDQEACDYYPSRLFEFYRFLLSARALQNLRSSAPSPLVRRELELRRYALILLVESSSIEKVK